MTVIDTPVLVAASSPEHPQHMAALALVEADILTVTRGTLIELAEVVRRQVRVAGGDGAQAARMALRTLVAMPGFREGNAAPLAKVLETYLADRRLSLVDAWNLSEALHRGERLLTFDRDLARAYARAKRTA